MLLLSLTACHSPGTDSSSASPTVSMTVTLRWTPESGGISQDEMIAGLAWSLSNLGALPPEEGWLTTPRSERNSVVFDLDLARVGFDERALPAVTDAIAPLQSSDERAALGSVDVGRFLMRTLYSPWRYYSITGACETFAEWSDAVRAPDTETYGVTFSLLTEDDRLIELNAGPWSSIGAVGFVARSGPGVLYDPSVSEEVEVIDLMSNGQQRYAVFDADGALVPAADPAIIAAGQPGKCMWCHEGSLMSGTPYNPTSRPHLSFPQWLHRINEMQGLLDAHRAGLQTAVDFTTYETHGYGERIVREFLKPTPQRIAAEWGISEEMLTDLIEEYGLELTLDEEYPSRGSTLSRVALDAVYVAELAEPGFVPLTILPDDREAPSEDAALEGAEALQSLPRCFRP